MKWHAPLVINTSIEKSAGPRVNLESVIEKGRQHTIQWDDLALASTRLIDLENIGLLVIERVLGYLPPRNVTLPFETYLRALIHSYRQNQLTDDAFTEQLTEHVKLIRNADMKPNSCLTYTSNNYEYYYKTFHPYGLPVRNRLTWLLGYEPPLDHSLIAELWLRTMLAQDVSVLSDGITTTDFRAVTLIKYREVLLSEGKQSADASYLYGL